MKYSTNPHAPSTSTKQAQRAPRGLRLFIQNMVKKNKTTENPSFQGLNRFLEMYR